MQKQTADELIKISDMHKNGIIYGRQTGTKESQKVKENKQPYTKQGQVATQQTPLTKAEPKKAKTEDLVDGFKKGQEKVLALINEQNQHGQQKNEQVQLNNLYYMMMQRRGMSGS